MDSAKLNDWMQVIGIFAVVASLIFVGLQMQQDREIAAVEAMSSRSGEITDLAEVIGNNKSVWVSGLNGDEMPDDDVATFHAMNEAVESYFASLWFRLDTIGVGNASPESVIDDYAFAIYTHTGLRRAWNGQMDYWDARNAAMENSGVGVRFRNRIKIRLSQLDKDAPPVPEAKRYVFW
jgi:hypothetical protein